MRTAIKGIFYGFMLFLGVLLALPGWGHMSSVTYTASHCESSREATQQHLAQVDQFNCGLSDLLHDVALEPVLSSVSAPGANPIARRHQSNGFSYAGFSCTATESPKVPLCCKAAIVAANLKSVEKLDPTQYYIYTLHRIRV